MSAASASAVNPRLVLADAIPGARVRDAALVLTGVALMSGLAQVAIPLQGSPVPITGQTLGVGLIGATLGMRRGVITMLLYVLAGLFLPVFSDGGQGIDRIIGANGGYILGFVVATGVIGWLAERGADRKVVTTFLAFVVAQVVVFAFGLAGLKIALSESWAWTIHNGFTVFIIGGLIKAALGGLALPGAWQAVRRFEGKRA